jgi:hypothetical protein
MSAEPMLGIYRGSVSNNQDPLNEARVTLLIPQVLGSAESAWAVPASPTNTVPPVGQTLWVQFSGGDITKPVYSPLGIKDVQDAVDGLPTGDTLDVLPPKEPTALTLTTVQYVTNEGATLARVQASWTAPTENQDGTNLTDLAHYVLQYSYDGTNWSGGLVTQDTLVVLDGLHTGVDVMVRVQAVDISSNVSLWASAHITSASSSTPPPVPSAPGVTGVLGGLRVTWDGKDVSGFAMPAIFSHVQVQRDTDPAFSNPVVVGTLPGADFLYDSVQNYASAYSYRLVAYSKVAIASAPSAANSGTAHQAGTGDIAANSVTANQMAAGTITAESGVIASIDASKITVGRLTASQIDATNLVISGTNVSGQVSSAATAGSATTSGSASSATTVTGSIGSGVSIPANQLNNGTIPTTTTINGGSITTGTISASVIGARSITTDKLVIGDTSNILLDPQFTQNSSAWNWGTNVVRTASTDPSVTAGAPASWVAKLISQTSLNTDLTWKHSAGTLNAMPVSPGETYYVEAWVAASSTCNSSLRFFLATSDAAGANTTWPATASLAPSAATTWIKISGQITIPAGKYLATFGVGPSQTTPTTAAGYWLVTNAKMRKAVDNALVVAGSITADKLDANAINGKTINGVTITGTSTITGATVRSAASGARVEMNSNNPANFAELLFYGATATDAPGLISVDGSADSRSMFIAPPNVNDTADTPYILLSYNGAYTGAEIGADALQVSGVLAAANIVTGRVTITPSAANTPTSVTVTGLGLTGSSPRAIATPSTTVPGTSVTGVGCTGVTTDSVTIWLTRTNTTATGVDYIVMAS